MKQSREFPRFIAMLHTGKPILVRLDGRGFFTIIDNGGSGSGRIISRSKIKSLTPLEAAQW